MFNPFCFRHLQTIISQPIAENVPILEVSLGDEENMLAWNIFPESTCVKSRYMSTFHNHSYAYHLHPRKTLCIYIYIYGFIHTYLNVCVLYTYCIYTYIHCETSILAPSARNTWMKHAICGSSTRSSQKAKRIYHGPTIGATNLEAGLLILILWHHFWVQNLALVLGPQNANRSQLFNTVRKCATAPQADSSTSVILRGTCPRTLLYHLFEAPVLGPWAHLRFEKKRLKMPS